MFFKHLPELMYIKLNKGVKVSRQNFSVFVIILSQSFFNFALAALSYTGKSIVKWPRESFKTYWVTNVEMHHLQKLHFYGYFKIVDGNWNFLNRFIGDSQTDCN